MRTPLRGLVLALLTAAPAAAQAPGFLDSNGYKIEPQIMYCLGLNGRVGPCGGPGAPVMTSTMPSQGMGGGLQVYRVNSPAGLAPMVVKATGGRLYSFNLCNNAGSSRYIRLYNSATVAVGTTPITAGPIVVSASSCQQFTSGFGLTFSSAITMSITGAPGDSDVTPITAGDVTGFVGFL